MKIAMTGYGNEMCDHLVDLTGHCGHCSNLERFQSRAMKTAINVMIGFDTIMGGLLAVIFYGIFGR